MIRTSSASRAQRLFELHQHLQWLYKASRTTRTEWYRQYLERRKHELKVEKATRKMLDDALEAVDLPAVTRAARKWWNARLRKGTKIDSKVMEALVSQRIADTLDVSTGEVQKALAGAAGPGVMQALEDMGLPPDIDWSHPEETFQQFFPEMVDESERLLQNAAGEHANAVAKAVARAADPAKPITIDQAIKNMREEVAGLSRRKASQIARTETARTYGKTAFETMKRNGISERRVLTAAKSPAAAISPVCSICMAAAKEGWVDLANPFSAGAGAMRYPPFHPNCRCDIGANTKGWLPPKKPWPPVAKPKPPDWLVPKVLPRVRGTDVNAAIRHWVDDLDEVEAIRNASIKIAKTGKVSARSPAEIRAAQLMRAIEEQGKVFKEVYRGMSIPKTSEGVLTDFAPGKAIRMPVSSFSKSRKAAEDFAREKFGSTKVIIKAQNTKAFDISKNVPALLESEKEVLVGGNYVVKSARVVEHMVRRVPITEGRPDLGLREMSFDKVLVTVEPA